MPDDLKLKVATPQAPPPAPPGVEQPPMPSPGLITDPSAPRAATEDIVDGWFRDHFAGTSLSATTEAYNAAFAAKEDLKKRLAR